MKAICLPLCVELYFFGARWRACGLTFWCVETKLEWHPLLSDVCSNYLAKYLVGTHFQNTWAQSVRNRHDSASFEANFLSIWASHLLKGPLSFNGRRWKLIPLLESLGDLLEQPTATQWTIFYQSMRIKLGANASGCNDVMPCSPAFNMAVKMADLHQNTAIFTQDTLFTLLQICKENLVFHLPFSFNYC